MRLGGGHARHVTCTESPYAVAFPPRQQRSPFEGKSTRRKLRYLIMILEDNAYFRVPSIYGRYLIFSKGVLNEFLVKTIALAAMNSL